MQFCQPEYCACVCVHVCHSILDIQGKWGYGKLQIWEGPWLLFVSCHEETQNKVHGFLPVLLRLPARQLGGRSDEEAAE